MIHDDETVELHHRPDGGLIIIDRHGRHQRIAREMLSPPPEQPDEDDRMLRMVGIAAAALSGACVTALAALLFYHLYLRG